MGKNANKRKSEKQEKVIPTSEMTAKLFIEECKILAGLSGWSSGYTPKLEASDQLNLEINKKIFTLPNREQMRVKIINAFPNYGTYYYTDGVVDYVLGSLAIMANTVES